MNAEKEGEADTTNRCASCGVKESDNSGDVKLKNCTACYLVKYCGVKCQKQHWKKHKRVCKERAAELRDEILFRQPESSDLGDCPICFLPLLNDRTKSTTSSCCIKTICMGCDYVNQMRERQKKQVVKCAFCRAPLLKSKAEADKRVKDRAEKNDPVAMRLYGVICRDKGDYQTAIQYWSKAAKLGDVGSHYQLGLMYYHGQGVEKDKLLLSVIYESKVIHHFEQAAIGGHPDARYNLGVFGWNNGQRERAIKHWIIAAKLGHGKALEDLKKEYKEGLVSEDDLAAALRGHQAAVDATRSSQREEGEAYFLNLR